MMAGESAPGAGAQAVQPLRTAEGEAERRAPALLAVRLGMEMAGSRLRARRPLLSLGLGLSLAIAAAVIEVSFGSSGAVDRALLATFRLILPLTLFALAADAARRTTLRDAAWPAARFGAPSHHVALGIALATALAGALVGALLALAVVVIARSPGDAPFVRDVLISGWVGALTGAAYAGWFSFGATFLRHGRGRFVLLAADFLLGGSAGVAGALLPRGHAVNLLGGPAPLGLGQPASAGLLALSALFLVLASAARSRD
ncbi:hypothetical protein WMF31_25215 [Sorangium sp. So ce1036]|uniref:hypothetical protein n=1 Tax=Sorangium sp. So ce1036 TaxID=3133328 RepID=UPI003F017FC7